MNRSTPAMAVVAPSQGPAWLVVTSAEVEGSSFQDHDGEFAPHESSSALAADRLACTPRVLETTQLPLGKQEATLARFLTSEFQSSKGSHHAPVPLPCHRRERHSASRRRRHPKACPARAGPRSSARVTCQQLRRCSPRR